MSTTASPPAARRTQPGSGAPPAVSVEQVSKRFRLPHSQYHTLKERVLHPIASGHYDELVALDDIGFDVAEGEFLGIVGRNGSGKSTLLKCLAGIYGADTGRISVRGRLSPFIELGVGFNPEMTSRDNVMINAIMLGLTRREARDRFDEIIDFAGLEEFVDLKLKNYSSGMVVRLGFAVAVQVDADVLLVDEVLAVGDAAFQQKCFDEFHRLKREGRTILFVTHDMEAVRRFSDRALLIERGRMLGIGDPQDISRKYGEINFGELGGGERSGGPGVPRVTVTEAWCEDESGAHVSAIDQGRRCTACMKVEFEDAADQVGFSIAFRNDVRHTIFVPGTDDSPEGRSFRAGETVVIRFGFENWLAPSAYTLTPRVHGNMSQGLLEHGEDLAPLLVRGERRTGGVADIPTSIEVTSP